MAALNEWADFCATPRKPLTLEVLALGFCFLDGLPAFWRLTFACATVARRFSMMAS